MIVQFVLLGLVLLSPPGRGGPGLYDWRAVSSHRSHADCERARLLFEGDQGMRDLQCVELKRKAP